MSPKKPVECFRDILLELRSRTLSLSHSLSPPIPSKPHMCVCVCFNSHVYMHAQLLYMWLLACMHTADCVGTQVYAGGLVYTGVCVFLHTHLVLNSRFVVMPCHHCLLTPVLQKVRSCLSSLLASPSADACPQELLGDH